MTRLSCLLAVLVFLAAYVAPVSAQQSAQQPGATFQFQNADPRDTEQRLMTARQFIRQNNYEAAAALLEVVYETAPDNATAVNLLKNCYMQLKQYGKAETIIRRSIQQSPQTLVLRVEMGEVLANQGQTQPAAAAYREALELITDRDRIKYLMIVRSELSHGLEDDALDLIASLRKELKDSTLFALERGTVLEKQKKYKDAIREYLPILAQDTTPESMEVERRLQLLLEFPESSPEVEKLLIAEAKQRQSKHTVSLLADYYIKANRFDQALQYAIKRDSLENTQGASLIYLMRQCFERKLYNETVRMGDYIMPRYKTGPGFMEASLLYARALANLGQTDRAKAVYDTVVATSPRDMDRGDALFELGRMYFEFLSDYRTALSYFDSVINHYRGGMSYVYSLRARPFCHMGLGDLAAARQGFENLRAQGISEEISEEVKYYLGLVDFFENRYDSAETAFRKLMVDHPTGFYVNDALQLVMVISEAKQTPELLADYARALWYTERRQFDSSRLWLDRLAQAEESPLADVALYKLTAVNMLMNDSSAAMESIERLDKNFPESYYRPYGLKMKADMLASDRATAEQAKKIYLELLEQFPNYPFASDVRKKLKQMETDFKVG